MTSYLKIGYTAIAAIQGQAYLAAVCMNHDIAYGTGYQEEAGLPQSHSVSLSCWLLRGKKTINA